MGEAEMTDDDDAVFCVTRCHFVCYCHWHVFIFMLIQCKKITTTTKIESCLPQKNMLHVNVNSR